MRLSSGRALSLVGSHTPRSREPQPVAEKDEGPSRRHTKVVEMADRLELGSSSPIEIALGQPSFDDQAVTASDQGSTLSARRPRSTASLRSLLCRARSPARQAATRTWSSRRRRWESPIADRGRIEKRPCAEGQEPASMGEHGGALVVRCRRHELGVALDLPDVDPQAGVRVETDGAAGLAQQPAALRALAVGVEDSNRWLSVTRRFCPALRSSRSGQRAAATWCRGA